MYPGGDLASIPSKELALGAASMLQNGQGTPAAMATIRDLQPKSYKGDFKEFVSTLLNEPLGKEQQAFVEQFARTILNEKYIAQNQIKAQLAQNAAGMVTALRGNGEAKLRFENEIMHPAHLTWDDVLASQKGYSLDSQTGKWYEPGKKAPGAAEQLSGIYRGTTGPNSQHVFQQQAPQAPKLGDTKVGKDGLTYRRTERGWESQ